MRVVLTTVGSRGDVEPVVGLAARLRERGADVRVCAPPDDDFAALLDRVGVPLVPLGPSVRSVVAGDRPPTAEDAFRFARELVDARFAALTEAGEGGDVLVASGLLPAGARDVAEVLGLAHVYACFQLYGMPSRVFRPGARPGNPPAPEETDLDVLWERDAQAVNALYGEALNANRDALGLPPVANVRDHVFTDRPWLAADPVLCPDVGPEGPLTNYEFVRTGAWRLDDDRELPGDLVEFLGAGEAPVYVGFGSIASYVPADIAQVSIDAVRAVGRRVVLSSGWAGLSGDGEDCFVVGEVNHQALFPRVAAVVHHGGAGTTTTAARAGVPQVVVPQIADQPYWGSRVAELGIGAWHDGGRPTVGSLTASLEEALRGETVGRAAAVGPGIRVDGAAVAADLLMGVHR